MGYATKRIAIAVSEEERHRLEALAADLSVPVATASRMILSQVLAILPDQDGQMLLVTLKECLRGRQDADSAALLADIAREGETAVLGDPRGSGGPTRGGPSPLGTGQGAPAGRRGAR